RRARGRHARGGGATHPRKRRGGGHGSTRRVTFDLVLVRHGRTEPQPGVPAASWVLARSALDEVRRLAEALAREAGGRVDASLDAPVDAPFDAPVDAVVTSSEPKAIATGRALARAWRVPATIGHDLEEHHRGATPVLAPEAWRQTIRRFFAQPDVLVFGSETAHEARSEEHASELQS